MLIVSRQGAQLIQSDGPFRLHIGASLGGVPTAAASLGSTQLVLVADSGGQLHVLDVKRGAVSRVSTSAPLPVASCLAFAPRWFDSGAAAVFLGSTSGSSVLLEVPSDLGSTWEVQPEAVVASLAPVRDAAVVQDPSGCGDARLLCCCGAAPRGRLAIAWLAGGLASLAEGPHIPGQVLLIPLRPSPASPHHSHLLLSFEGEHSTVALAAAGGSLAEAALPGLLCGCATLLAAAMPAGHLLQVTPEQARVARLADGALASAWQHGPISLAALHGQFLALASGGGVLPWRFCCCRAAHSHGSPIPEGPEDSALRAQH